MLILAGIFALAYLAVILIPIMEVEVSKAEPILHSLKPDIKFSVIVPFRNESENIEQLIGDLANQEYDPDSYEVICVDDHSKDSGREKIANLNIPTRFKILQCPQNLKGKKAALKIGIDAAAYPYIITIDADCRVPNHLLMVHADMYEKKKADMLIGAVSICLGDSFLEQFQTLDYSLMQLLGLGFAKMGLPVLATGAHLSFRKSLFDRLQGYEKNLHISSGDDLFLLLKFRKIHAIILPVSVQTLIYTKPVASWKKLIAQRVRWAAKSAHLNDIRLWIISLVIFAMNAGILAGIFLCVIGILSGAELLFFVAVKFFVDLVAIARIQQAFHIHLNPVFCIFSIMLYPVFCLIAGFWSITGSFTWKERRYSC